MRKMPKTPTKTTKIRAKKVTKTMKISKMRIKMVKIRRIVIKIIKRRMVLEIRMRKTKIKSII